MNGQVSTRASCDRQMMSSRAKILFKVSRFDLAGEISPGNKVVYEKRVKPAFERQHGRPPRDSRDVRQMMTLDPYYQMWSVLQRTSQEYDVGCSEH